MATVTSPHKPFNRADADRRVRHPLHAIRGYIRRYVLIEGLALAVLFVAIAFWLGLLVDFMTWTIFSFDWLYTFEEVAGAGPTVILRTAFLTILLGLLVLLVATKIIRRLFKEFSDAAVALLLERRYPKELGDRLITAVEMADPRLSQKYGYSQDMVDVTIRDAAARVEKLPVHEIFRWGRLTLLVALALLASIGLYLFVGAAWCIANMASPVDFAIRFHHTASIWGERNLLMSKSFWPPSTLVELVRFPGAELRVPREEDRPDVKIRYIRWTIAGYGDDAPRGWKALRFDDLAGLLPADMLDIKLPAAWDGWIVDLDDLDGRVPVGAIPAEWGWQGITSGQVKSELVKEEVRQILDRVAKDKPGRDDMYQGLYEMFNWRGWTVDKIELQLQAVDNKTKKKPVADAMLAEHPKDYAKFLAIMEKLEELADKPVMERTLRKMNDPTQVVAMRKSKSGGGSTTCDAVADRKFLFQLKDLKESCQFSIVSTYETEDPWSSLKLLPEDYWTAWREIVLVPPPLINRLLIDKEEPAYLYYRLPQDPEWLKSKRQKISSVSVSTSGPYTKVLVPFGSDVKITGHSDRGLKDIRVAEIDAKKREEKTSITLKALVELAGDRQTFHCAFKDVQRIVEFDFEFKDSAGVKGSRRIIIVPLEDQAPKFGELSLAVTPRILQPTDDNAKGIAAGPRYVITPDAFLKWRGKVEDDHGLARLQYKYEVQESDFIFLFAEPTDTKVGDLKEGDAKKPSRGVAAEIVAGGLLHDPGSTTFGFFAATYYGGLAQIVKEGSLPPPPPRVELIELDRARQRLSKVTSWDVSPQELQRLLTIQPDYRKRLLEALDLTAEKRTLLAFTDRLKETNQTEGFLQEVMDFAGMAANGIERDASDTLAVGDPAEALAKILQRLKADPVQLQKTRELLEKQPEKTILTRYDLQEEDPAFGFDLRNPRYKLDSIKAIGSTATQKHYALRVSIVATDNNVNTGPGVTTAGLPYSFLIISENELLALMMIDQRKYKDLLYAAVQELEKSRQHLISQLDEFHRAPEEPTKLLVRADAARKALRDGGITAKAILGRYESLLKEMDFNRMKKERVDNLKNRVADPLASLTGSGGGFPRAEELASRLYKNLSPDADKKDKADQEQRGNDPVLIQELRGNKAKHAANADETIVEMTDLIGKLNKILDAMGAELRHDELIEQMVHLEAAQRELDLFLRRYQRAAQEELLRQLRGGGAKDQK